MKKWFGKKTETFESVLQREVANAIQTLKQEGLKANADQSEWRTRIAAAISGGYDGADKLHNVYTDFGYPETLVFSNYWNMYRRFGIAKSVVELPVDVTWMSAPKIENASGSFDTEFEKLVKQLKLWNRLKGLDVRQRVGRYAGLFVRARDGKSPDLELGQLNGPGSVIELIPIYEGQLTVLSTNDDVMSDDFGKPTLYQYQSSGSGNRNELAAVSISIHPSRLILAAEGADDGTIYGTPALEACYNSLMDLRKIIGAGGEGFYKNTAQSVLFKLTDVASATANKELLSKFDEKYDDFIRNPFRRGLWTPGLEPSVLNTNLPQPKEFFDNAMNDVAASSKIPATVIIGQQTGRLASDEDVKSMMSLGNSRRENYATPLIQSVIDWFIKHSVLPATDYDVVWDDLLAMSDDEKMAVAIKMAEVNHKQFTSGEPVPFESKEIRLQAGFEVEPEDEHVDDELDKETEPEDEYVDVTPLGGDAKKVKVS